MRPAAARSWRGRHKRCLDAISKIDPLQGFIVVGGHKEGYRARYSGGLFAAPELPGVAPPLAVLTGAGAGLTGARGRRLGLGEQLVEIATQHPHAAADAQRGQQTRIYPVTNRLLVELERRGDLRHGQKLIGRVRRAALRAHARGSLATSGWRRRAVATGRP